MFSLPLFKVSVGTGSRGEVRYVYEVTVRERPTPRQLRKAFAYNGSLHLRDTDGADHVWTDLVNVKVTTLESN